MIDDRQHHRGFTLVEMLLALTLLAVFSLMAFRLIGANTTIARGTLYSNWNTASFDRAVGTLRADVADANAIEMPAPGKLRIHRPGDHSVDWKATDHSLSRSAGARLQTWEVGQAMDIKLDGAVVLLSVTPSDQIAMAPLPKAGSR